MAITLSIEHVDGIRLRQQLAQAERVDSQLSGGLIKGTNNVWHFETKPGSREHLELPLDLDSRTRKPLNTYSAVINYGLKNLVIEKKGAAIQLAFRNSSVRNQLRIKYQTFTDTGKRTKSGEEVKEWRDNGTPQYLAPQTWGGVAIGDGLRAILDEMPT